MIWCSTAMRSAAVRCVFTVGNCSRRFLTSLALRPQEAQKRFGFLLKAFEYGAPPHAGVAYGIDRLVTIITGNESIRDCIAFPKTQKGTCLMTDAPSDVDAKQLKELGLVVLNKK